MVNVLIGEEKKHPVPSLTQVYKVTHDGKGNRLPFMNRSFISFTYGGKHIEDFDLIATNSGDRMERDAYASFDDLTTTYDVIHGQFYWGTYFRSNTLTFNLTTDEMTQNELDDFKRWFRAGSIRELILAEHPNRGILARVSEPPQLSILPFEKKVSVPFVLSGGQDEQENPLPDIPGGTYTTSTTVYRGDITLTLVMDDPFWYSIKNILGEQNTLQGYYEETWHDANGKLVSVKDSPDALKVIYEDRIPLGSTTAIDVFLGGDTYASVKYEVNSLIAQETNVAPDEWADIVTRRESGDTSDEVYSYSSITTEQETEVDGEIVTEDVTTYYVGAHIATVIQGTPPDVQYVGARIGGASLTGLGEVQGVDMRSDQEANLYYAGTAPSPVKMRFTLTPQIGANFYMVTPFNKHSSSEVPYNTITLQAIEKHEFKFSLPTFWVGYNQILEIFDNENIIKPGIAWLTVREAIRNTIRHPIIRAWANKIINKYDNNGGIGVISSSSNLSSIRADLKDGMSLLLLDNEGIAFPAEFLFDGKTGLAIGKFTYRNVNTIQIESADTTLREQIIHSSHTWEPEVDGSGEETGNEIMTGDVENYLITSEENVGDMVKSSYLILDERNVLDGYYRIQKWTEEHPDYAYLITHDVPTILHDIHFEFKNLYL